jgi:hypothetical protein
MATRTDAVVEFIAGSAEDLVVPLLDDADAPIPDFTGWSARCQVRYAPNATSPVLVEWATGAANPIVLAGSEARLKVNAALALASLSWTWRLAWWDLVLTSPAGLGALPNRPIRGLMRVVQGVTR